MRSLILLLLAAVSGPVFAQSLSKPSNVTAVASSGTAVTVSWSAATVTPAPTPAPTVNYIVTRTGGGGEPFVSAQQPGTSFSDSGLTPGTTYTYIVAAATAIIPIYNSVSDSVSVTTPVTPPVPTGLAGSATDAGVVLTWNAVSGAIRYVIFRNGTEIDTSTGRTYTDEDVDPATTYRYSVASTNAAGDSDETAEITITTKGDGSQREAVWTREFERADGNFDEVVTFQEYLVAFPNTLPWVVMNHRFNSTDDDISGDLTVDEYILHFAGKTVKRPSKAQTFFIADLDGDDLLDVDEYSLTLNRGTKFAQVQKKFDKLDKSDSGMLSQREFGIRYGTAE
jgi:hypothetical protein